MRSPLSNFCCGNEYVVLMRSAEGKNNGIAGSIIVEGVLF